MIRICHVGHGVKSIPPRGWGAVESLIWEYKLSAEKYGHEFHVVNTSDREAIVLAVNAINPDVVHVHNERYVDLMGRLNAKVKIICPHCGHFFSAGHSTFRKSIYEQHFPKGCFYVCCLSDKIRDYFLRIGVDPLRLFVSINGASALSFRFAETPKFPGKSAYLGRVLKRKRQYLVQGIESIDFIGPRGDLVFDYTLPNYLGQWPKAKVHSDLTEYANLVLLSESEAAPLVVYEALIAGLGLVLSEKAVANIDLPQPFVSVIPEARMGDINYINEEICRNRRVALSMRKEIRQYAVRLFDWDKIVGIYLDRLKDFLNRPLPR